MTDTEDAFVAWLEQRLAKADGLSQEFVDAMAEIHDSPEQKSFRENRAWREQRGMTT